MATAYECPWCGFASVTEYDIHLHIEEQHTEGSRFVSTATGSAETLLDPSSAQKAEKFKRVSDDDAPVKCTRPGCGKRIRLDGIDEHIIEHESSGDKYQGTSPQSFEPELSASLLHQKAKHSHSRAARPARSESAPLETRSHSILSFFTGRSARTHRYPLEKPKDRGRLGTKELGQYAFEKVMPASVRRALEDAARPVAENRITASGRLTRYTYYPNETSGLIRILADICALDSSTTTYFCHADVKHIHRISCEGNFCGYWNIQMLLSYILATTDPQRGLPTVLQIQDIIEKAWSNNICSYGRVETGGIFNTRKWIGTHEALAFFRQLDVQISASSFQSHERPAYKNLLDFVEAYFLASLSTELEGCNDNTSVMTQLPPVYLQRAGHSVAIVGLARQGDGEKSLLVFDPSHETTSAMSRLLDGRSVRTLPDALIKPYRWSESRLAAWDEYETLIIDSSQAIRTMPTT